MPSERSLASAITGEKAAREKVRSISSQTCCKAAWSTESVIASSFALSTDMSGLANVDDDVAVSVGACAVARFEHGGRVHLFEDRRPFDDRIERQLFPAIDRRVVPAPGVPDRSDFATRRVERFRPPG